MLTPREVRAALPHRYPMLLVDRVLETGEDSIRAVKSVTLNEPWYARLGPNPSPEDLGYPDFLLIESWTQTAGLLATRLRGGEAEKQVMLFGSMSDVSFHGRVMPGHTLEQHVRLERAVGDTMIFTGRSTVDGEPVLTVGAATVAFRPGEALRPDGPPAS